MGDFIKTTFFRGLKLIVPLFLVIFVLEKIYQLIISFLEPVVEIMPEISYFGKDYVDLRALLTFLIFVFICGLILRAGLGDSIYRLLATILFKIFPGSSILDHIIREKTEPGMEGYNKVVMMNIDDGWVIGIIVEEKNQDGFLRVYVPSAPVPTSGNLYMMPEDKVRRVSIPVHQAISYLWHLGRNSDKIFKNKLNL